KELVPGSSTQLSRGCPTSMPTGFVRYSQRRCVTTKLGELWLLAPKVISSRVADTARAKRLTNHPPDNFELTLHSRTGLPTQCCGGYDSTFARLLLRNSFFRPTPRPGPGGTSSFPFVGVPVAVAIET